MTTPAHTDRNGSPIIVGARAVVVIDNKDFASFNGRIGEVRALTDTEVGVADGPAGELEWAIWVQHSEVLILPTPAPIGGSK